MKGFINIFIIFKIFLTLYSPVFSNEKREIIKAYEKGKPAKLDIEVTKVKSDNFIQLEIDRKKRKIFKNITEFSDKDKDLDRKLYVTTYLKPSAKTNTVGDELNYKITTSNNKKYLEIDYDKEPKNVYLWVVKNEKVEKLYTGVFSDITPEVVYNNTAYISSTIISSGGEFNFKINKTNPVTVNHSDNLYGFSGNLGGWNNVNHNHNLKIDLFFTPENGVEYKYDGSSINIPVSSHSGSGRFSTTEFEKLNFTITSSNMVLDFKFNNFNFKKVRIDFYYNNGGSTNQKADDSLEITFPTFEISASDMDFKEFHKLEGATAYSNITIANSTNLNFQLNIPGSINITHVENSRITIPVGLTLENNKITGNISKPTGDNNAYTEGSYKGLIPLEVILSPKTKGGKF